ncbi:MAG: SGNH/GDSL hydrolase family protein [Clostridia bacterium]|nr:SGNH/GDSL hydrolase family protein [Clostridia bacterium]
MSELTYEPDNGINPLETYEWDSTWWEHTEIGNIPVYLYIGDSISNGTRPSLNRLADGKRLFDGFATSKALDNPFFVPSLELFMKQGRKYSAILFNNGLHGWHINDGEEYFALYCKMLDFLVSTGIPVYVVLTTNLPDDEKQNQRVIKRNALALKAAEKYGCKVIDLYDASLLCKGKYCGDGVHFHTDGYDVLASRILDKLKRDVL